MMHLLAFLTAVDRIQRAFRVAALTGERLTTTHLTIGAHAVVMPACVLREFVYVFPIAADSRRWIDATTLLRESSLWPGFLHLCTGGVFAWTPGTFPALERSHETLAHIGAVCPRLVERLDQITYGVHEIFGYALDTAPTRESVSRVFGIAADDEDVALVYLCVLAATLADSSTTRSPDISVALVSGKCTYADGTQGFLSDLSY